MVLSSLGFVIYGVILLVHNLTGGVLASGFLYGDLSDSSRALLVGHPQLVEYINHLRLRLAGFVITTGLVLGMIAYFGVRSGHQSAWWTQTIGFPAIALTLLPTHLSSDAYPSAWVAPFYAFLGMWIAGAIVSYRALH